MVMVPPISMTLSFSQADLALQAISILKKIHKMMKKLLIVFSLYCFAIVAQAQGLDSIIVEKYYVANAADAAYATASETNPLPVGSVTWRFYVAMKPGYNVQMAYGNASHPLEISTTTSFFNNEDNGSEVPSYSAVNAKKGTAMLDSWLTMGSAAAGAKFWGVLKSEDTDAPFINANGLLQNTVFSAGIPLTTQDGLLAGTGVPTASFLGTDPVPVFGTGANNKSYVVNGGSWYFLGGVKGPTANNRVLIAQITTDGTLTYNLNILLGKDLGGGMSLSEKYVYSNPAVDEISGDQYKLSGTLSALTISPSVSITSPAEAASYTTGDVVSILTNAADADGAVTKVEFFTNDVSIGTDTDGNDGWSLNWTSVAGSASLKAVATDDDFNTTTSAAVSIEVVNPVVPPTVSITSPVGGSELLTNSQYTLTADASDADGTVTSVEFFVDGVSLGVDNSSPFTFLWTPTAVAANVNITAKATDNGANSTVSSTVNVSVAAPIVFPAVSVTSPADASKVNINTLVTLTANATDADGSVISVEFFVDGISVGIDNSGPQPFTVSWTPTIPGSVSITAKATDNGSNLTTSAAVSLTVQDPTSVITNKEVSFMVYPNPSNGIFNVIAPEAATVELMDISGRTILFETEISANLRQEINVSNLSNGIYMLKVYNNNDLNSVKRLVISK
jgi:hypothetical protein